MGADTRDLGTSRETGVKNLSLLVARKVVYLLCGKNPLGFKKEMADANISKREGTQHY